MAIVQAVSVVHLTLIAFWGGVVATEAVLELYPYRHRELQRQTVTFHYWIDLLVELPVVCGVVGTGLVLAALAWPLSPSHWVKIACAVGAVAANGICVVLVLARKRSMAHGASDADLWDRTRRVLLSAELGLPLGLVAAALGFWLAYQRMLSTGAAAGGIG